MTLLMAEIASSPVVLPASKRMEPSFGKASARGTERVAGQGRARRRVFAGVGAFGEPVGVSALLVSANFSTSTSRRPNLAAFWNSPGGVQSFQRERSHSGNMLFASAFALSSFSQRG